MKKFLVRLLATIGAMVVILIVGLIILVQTTQFKRPVIHDNSVLLINFPDELPEYQQSGFLGQILGAKKMSLRDAVEAIDKASSDDRIVGIVARLDHAGMGFAQTQEIRNAIKRFNKKNASNDKFTIAHSDTFGELSPGTMQYYLASAFNEIWLQNVGSVCLTGFYYEMPFARAVCHVSFCETHF